MFRWFFHETLIDNFCEGWNVVSISGERNYSIKDINHFVSFFFLFNDKIKKLKPTRAERGPSDCPPAPHQLLELVSSTQWCCSNHLLAVEFHIYPIANAINQKFQSE